MIYKDKNGRIIKMYKAYYFTDNGTSTFMLTHEQRLKFNHFCRNLGRKPDRNDFNRFLRIIR